MPFLLVIKKGDGKMDGNGIVERCKIHKDRRLVIPKRIRDIMDLHTGDKVRFETQTNGSIVMVKA